jgi:hypothetical protein
MSRPQRRQRFVDSKVQGALARRVIFHWFVLLTVASVVALLMQVLSDPFRPAGEHFRAAWATQGPFLIVMLFLLPVFILDTIKISHRFAGPIFGFRRSMREIIEGQPPRKLKFREGDFWHDLADDYNAMLAKLAPHVEEAASTEQTAEPAKA